MWAACDVADRAALGGLLAGTGGASGSGVVHTAGVLDDGVIGSLTGRAGFQGPASRRWMRPGTCTNWRGIWELAAFVCSPRPPEASVVRVRRTTRRANVPGRAGSAPQGARGWRRRRWPGVCGPRPPGWPDAWTGPGGAADRGRHRAAGRRPGAGALRPCAGVEPRGGRAGETGRQARPRWRPIRRCPRWSRAWSVLRASRCRQRSAGRPAGPDGGGRRQRAVAEAGSVLRRPPCSGTPGLRRSTGTSAFRELGIDSLTAVELRNRLVGRDRDAGCPPRWSSTTPPRRSLADTSA